MNAVGLRPHQQVSRARLKEIIYQLQRDNRALVDEIHQLHAAVNIYRALAGMAEERGDRKAAAGARA